MIHFYVLVSFKQKDRLSTYVTNDPMVCFGCWTSFSSMMNFYVSFQKPFRDELFLALVTLELFASVNLRYVLSQFLERFPTKLTNLLLIKMNSPDMCLAV